MDIEGQIVQFMSSFENVVGVMIDGMFKPTTEKILASRE